MKLRMKDLPLSERPYEKMKFLGSTSLSNCELLAIIIKTGTKKETALEVAQNLLNLIDNKGKNTLRDLQNLSIEEFMTVKRYR